MFLSVFFNVLLIVFTVIYLPNRRNSPASKKKLNSLKEKLIKIEKREFYLRESAFS